VTHPAPQRVNRLLVRHLGEQPYEPTLQAMKTFTDNRDANTPDELWLLEHPPVFTQGQAGRAEHLLAPGDIPVVQVDRGGQVTYHGPGQLVGYIMADIRRRDMGVRDLVTALEQSVVNTLAHWSIEAAPRRDAPGVYTQGCKIASLGLRVRRGCSYHGLALNVDMDLSPFQRINPCGYAGMPVTSISDCVGKVSVEDVVTVLQRELMTLLGYDDPESIATSLGN